MANAVPARKGADLKIGKATEIVAVTCEECGVRSYRKGEEGCPNGCKPKAKRTTKPKTEENTDSSKAAGEE
jgi:ribosomal protein L37E